MLYKKFLSLSVIFSMLYLLVLPINNVYAEPVVDVLGSGTYKDPYLITTCSEFMYINTINDGMQPFSYRLLNDLDCSGEGNNIIVGSEETPFYGVFDGNGKTITVDIDVDNQDYIGLFANIYNSELLNLHVSGEIDVTGQTEYVGGVVGKVGEFSYIYRVASTVNIQAPDSFYVGGLAGYLGSNATIYNSYSSSLVTGNNFVGGLTGFNYDYALIENSYAIGDVEGEKFVGGLSGYNYNNVTIRSSFADNNITYNGIDSENEDLDIWFPLSNSLDDLKGNASAFVLGFMDENNDPVTYTNLGNNGFDAYAVSTSNTATILSSDITGLIGSGDLEFSFLMRANAYPDTSKTAQIMIMANNMYNQTAGIRLDDNGILTLASSNGGAQVLISTVAPLELGENYLVTANYTDLSDSWSFYVNNQLVGSEAFTSGTTQFETMVGLYLSLGNGVNYGDVNPNGTGLNGYIGQLGIFNAIQTSEYNNHVYNNGDILPLQSELVGSLVGYAYTENGVPGTYFYNNYYGINSLGANSCFSYFNTIIGQFDLEDNCEGVDTVENPTYFYDSESIIFSNESEDTFWNEDYKFNTWLFSDDNYPELYIHAEQDGDFSGEGSGTVLDPFVITTCQEWSEINYSMEAHYEVLVGNPSNTLDCSGLGNAAMIRNNYDSFEGVIDGNDATIIFDIEYLNNEMVGPIARAKFAQISNLNFAGVVTANYEWVGGFIGNADYIELNNVSSSVDVTVIEGALETISSIGGLIGESDDSTVTNSFSSGSVIVSETDSEYVGGLIGESDETIISNSYATGDVKGGEYVGGLIGDSDGDNIITNSFATGNVWGYEDVGGLIGDTEDGDEFYRVYALGTVTAEGGSNFGGLIGRAEETVIEDAYARGWIVGEGYNVGGLIGNSYTVELTNAYATGKIEVDGSNFGGLIGDYEDTVVTAGFWDYELSEEDYTEGDIGEAKTTAEMKVLATFTTELVEYAWDFDQVWAVDVNGENNDGYPYFQWQEFDNEEVDDEDNEDNRNSGSSSGSRVSKQVTVSENIVEDVSQKTYTQEVQEILAKGIVTEKPESETNKCEALVMLSRVFDWEVPIVSTTKYTDVPEWCISVAAFGTERGIVEGRTPTTLGMETPVTRNEVALMLYRELKLQKYEFIGTLVVNFEDVLTPWAAEAITTLAKEGIIKGYSNGTFGGENNILKQDLGVMLLRVAS